MVESLSQPLVRWARVVVYCNISLRWAGCRGYCPDIGAESLCRLPSRGFLVAEKGQFGHQTTRTVAHMRGLNSGGFSPLPAHRLCLLFYPHSPKGKQTTRGGAPSALLCACNAAMALLSLLVLNHGLVMRIPPALQPRFLVCSEPARGRCWASCSPSPSPSTCTGRG